MFQYNLTGKKVYLSSLLFKQENDFQSGVHDATVSTLDSENDFLVKSLCFN